MVKYDEFTILSKKYNVLIPITDEVKKIALQSGIRNGIVYIITQHTTTGIMVNEKLECLEDDILNYLSREIPEDGWYYHNRFLHSYGAMAGNPTGHLKSMLSGNHCAFPIVEGEMVLGSAQEIYLAEFDGPQARTVSVSVMGE